MLGVKLGFLGFSLFLRRWEGVLQRCLRRDREHPEEQKGGLDRWLSSGVLAAQVGGNWSLNP